MSHFRKMVRDSETKRQHSAPKPPAIRRHAAPKPPAVQRNAAVKGQQQQVFVKKKKSSVSSGPAVIRGGAASRARDANPSFEQRNRAIVARNTHAHKRKRHIVGGSGSGDAEDRDRGGHHIVRAGKRGRHETHETKAEEVKEKEVVSAVSKGNRYHVDPSSFTRMQLDFHTAKLTFIPKQAKKGRFAKKEEGYKAFKLTRDLFSVPAEYGLKVWGPAATDNTTLGHPMKKGIKFALTLWDSEFFPQKQARRAVWKHFESRRGKGTASGILALPCAAGKTYTAAGIVIPMGRRTAVIVHQEELMDQMVESFMMSSTGGIQVGVVHKKTCEVGDEYDVVVMMIPTLLAMLRSSSPREVAEKIRADTFGFLLGDEAHHLAAREFMKVLYLFNPKYCLWLTATPHRDDGLTEQLMFLTGPIIFRGPERKGMINGVAIRYKVVREIPERLGEVDFMGLVSQIATDPLRNHWAAHVIGQMVDDNRTVAVFTLRAEQQIPMLLQMVHEVLMKRERDRGTPYWRHRMALPDGTMEQGPLIATCMSTCKRETMDTLKAMPHVHAFINGRGKKDVKMRNKFRMKLARVIIVYLSKFSEGVNIPWLDTLMYLGAFKGENSTVQSVNRATRPMPNRPTGHDKQRAFFIDVSDDIVAPAKSGMMLNIQRVRMRTLKRVLQCRVATMDVRAGTTPSADFFQQCLAAVPKEDPKTKEDYDDAADEVDL